MFYRKFGQTGVEVSALGMGCMRFERPDDVDDMAQVVYHAFERGVTYIDTAPFYCGDKSEIIVGTAVKEMKKTGKPFHIATKTSHSDPAEVRKQCELSLERLNLDSIDFYHVWCIVHPGQYSQRKANGVIDEFLKLKEEGLVKHVCVSTHLEHDRIAGLLDEGDGVLEGVLMGLSAINYDLRGPGAKEAARRGLGVVTMNSLGGGLITGHPDHFGFIMQEDDENILDAALRFNLSLPEVTVVLAGFRNIADVDSAIDAVERFRPLPEEAIEGVRAKLGQANKDFCTQCGYCRDCPADIPVVRIMEAYNNRMLDGSQAALGRLKWHWGIPDICEALKACTECRQCEEACTQHLPILKRFDELRDDQERAQAQQ